MKDLFEEYGLFIFTAIAGIIAIRFFLHLFSPAGPLSDLFMTFFSQFGLIS